MKHSNSYGKGKKDSKKKNYKKKDSKNSVLKKAYRDKKNRE